MNWLNKDKKVKSPSAGNQSEDSKAMVLRLSDDIAAMSERIGDMADRIGDMSERILETQRIQSENMELMQKSYAEMMEMMGKQLAANTKVMATLASSSVDTNPFD